MNLLYRIWVFAEYVISIIWPKLSLIICLHAHLVTNQGSYVVAEFMSIEIETTKCYRLLDSVTGCAIRCFSPSTLVSCGFRTIQNHFLLIVAIKWFGTYSICIVWCDNDLLQISSGRVYFLDSEGKDSRSFSLKNQSSKIETRKFVQLNNDKEIQCHSICTNSKIFEKLNTYFYYLTGFLPKVKNALISILLACAVSVSYLDCFASHITYNETSEAICYPLT